LSLRNTLLLPILLTLFASPLSLASSQKCDQVASVECILSETLGAIQPNASSENTALLMEIAFEAYLTDNDSIFESALSLLATINKKHSTNFRNAIRDLKPLLAKGHKPTLGNAVNFPTPETKSLAEEEIILHSINNKTFINLEILDESNRKFNDSLRWPISNYYYLTLIREVELKKSKELRTKLIHWLSLAPREEHKAINLSLSLMETIGGALRLGDSTRKTSRISAFSPPDLNHLNQRVIFYQRFTRFYNNHIGLKKNDCQSPITTTGNSISLFFHEEHKPLIQMLENLTLKTPNDFLITGSIISYLNSCSATSDFFLQRFLNETQATKSVQARTSLVRAFRRFSKA